VRRQLLPAIRVLLVLPVLTGLLYPLAVTGIAQTLFPHQANGSLILGPDGKPVGSRWLGQNFTAPEYSNSGNDGYDGTATGASNAGPTNEEFLTTVAERVAAYRQENGLPPDVDVPVDAVTASGSGWDPHISVANARLQAPRVATARGLDVAVALELVAQHTDGRGLGFLGEPAVNVVELNLALDRTQ
jgi:potassium-transporting ATPase KdpC subunit